MIKVTNVKTTTIILPDNFKEEWLKQNFDEEDEEYEEYMELDDEEFLADMDLIEDFLDTGILIDLDEDEEQKIEKI